MNIKNCQTQHSKSLLPYISTEAQLTPPTKSATTANALLALFCVFL